MILYMENLGEQHIKLNGTSSLYWFKILSAHNNKYVKMIYERLPRKVNWASLVRHLLMTLGFMMFGLDREWEVTMVSCQYLNKDLLIILFNIGIPD